jgi:peptide/nickel transport system ATP-binding protein/oligopeptide transport system ATP-binding protein
MILQGEMPSALAPPAGCRFHTRCPFAVDRCAREAPSLVVDANDHAAACHRIAELPPAEAVVPANGGFAPALEKLVAAFSLPREAAPPAGVGIGGDNVKSVSPNV